MSLKRKLLLIFNPKSGVQRFTPYLFEIIDKLTAAGFLVTAYPTQAAGEVRQMIAQYAEGFDYLVCSGGDGTISEAIDALMRLKKRPAFGIIPSGTVNDFAVSLDIPKDVLTAADVITGAVPRPVDVGRFGDKHFSYVAAFGMFTDVSYSTPQNTKNMIGKLAYFVEGIKRIGAVSPTYCEVMLDDEMVRGEFSLGVVGNAHSIAGFKIPEEIGVHMDDGLFEVLLVRELHTIKDRQELISYLLNQDTKTNSAILRKVRKASFHFATPTAWTLDGDFGGQVEKIYIENQHHAIEVLMPFIGGNT
ncbi:MAG: YegS/Rv2252/BmrU family lipid kinase [Defluviitaleaceae bacterium]|nr:YegS/Rv2252/BmrU family lipid kinase [Defluviitaleaceae bacterium]